MKGGVWESVVGGRGRPVKRHGGSCSIKDGGGAATTLCAGKGGGGGGSGYGIDKVLPYVCHILIIFFSRKGSGDIHCGTATSNFVSFHACSSTVFFRHGERRTTLAAPTTRKGRVGPPPPPPPPLPLASKKPLVVPRRRTLVSEQQSRSKISGDNRGIAAAAAAVKALLPQPVPRKTTAGSQSKIRIKGGRAVSFEDDQRGEKEGERMASLMSRRVNGR